jgi:hypothetical protein
MAGSTCRLTSDEAVDETPVADGYTISEAGRWFG